MFRRLPFVVLPTLLLVLPGCTWLWSTGMGGPRQASQAASQAVADVRAAIPAIEAYRADNGSYRGIAVGGLRTTYDASLPDVRIVVVSGGRYCVESDVEGVVYSKKGPAAAIAAGACPQAPTEPPGAAEQLRTVAVAMEARFARTGSFEGVTSAWLRRMVPGLRNVVVVRADATSYCIEATGQGHTYALRGPSGEVALGRCS